LSSRNLQIRPCVDLATFLLVVEMLEVEAMSPLYSMPVTFGKTKIVLLYKQTSISTFDILASITIVSDSYSQTILIISKVSINICTAYDFGRHYTGLRGRRRTYHTILKLADHALCKMVRYVLLRPLRPELGRKLFKY
jgi:hypothetical protein